MVALHYKVLTESFISPFINLFITVDTRGFFEPFSCSLIMIWMVFRGPIYAIIHMHVHLQFLGRRSTYILHIPIRCANNWQTKNCGLRLICILYWTKRLNPKNKSTLHFINIMNMLDSDVNATQSRRVRELLWKY